MLAKCRPLLGVLFLTLALTACGTPPPTNPLSPPADALPPQALEDTLPETDTADSAESVSAPVEPYDFTSPVPESDPVDIDYFADAAFIGDSRSDGFMLFSGIYGATNLTYNGLSIFSLDTKTCFTLDGEPATVYQMLEEPQYKKIYLSLGINELGYYDDNGYYQGYLDAIDTIRTLQPTAVIYLQGLIPLNESVIQATGGASYLTNEHLLIYNDLMKQAAAEKQVVFLDLNTHFADQDGQLPADASNDGVHPTKEYYEKWLVYLKCHTISFEALYTEVVL